MIISASRRTDIPAFYADWFMTRVREEHFYRVNPFNSRQVAAFSLKPEDVDAVCFWTKNPQPLMKHLPELDGRGFSYYFQFTLNPYDTTFEPHVPPLPERIETMIELAGRIGPERVVWRYDPVVLSSVTPVSWHLEQAAVIADGIREATRRLMFSFYDFYGRGRLGRVLAGRGITLDDIAAPEHVVALGQIARGFKAVADHYDFDIFTCCETAELSDVGIRHGACIDAALIREQFNVTVSPNKDKNQRDACRCAASADMGFYNTCPYRCIYCYANYNEATIAKNCRRHRPDSPTLLDEHNGTIAIRTRSRTIPPLR